MKRLRLRISRRPIGPPSSRENSWVPGSLFGQAQVLPMTKPAKRSGCRVATANPIGPPQSWTIIVTPERSSCTTSCSITSACSAGVNPYPGAADDSPKPG
jgi:hypothetical protein